MAHLDSPAVGEAGSTCRTNWLVALGGRYSTTEIAYKLYGNVGRYVYVRTYVTYILDVIAAAYTGCHMKSIRRTNSVSQSEKKVFIFFFEMQNFFKCCVFFSKFSLKAFSFLNIL